MSTQNPVKKLIGYLEKSTSDDPRPNVVSILEYNKVVGIDRIAAKDWTPVYVML